MPDQGALVRNSGRRREDGSGPGSVGATAAGRRTGVVVLSRPLVRGGAFGGGLRHVVRAGIAGIFWPRRGRAGICGNRGNWHGVDGLKPDAPNSRIETFPRLPKSLEWVRLKQIPVLRNEITVEHRGNRETRLTNHAGPVLWWTPAFPGEKRETVEVRAGQTHVASASP